MGSEDFKHSRRAFSAQALALGAAFVGGGLRLGRAAATSVSVNQPRSWQARLADAPKLFCIAYITPDATGQGGQEAAVARYPMTIVPQDRRNVHLRWREKVRELNPNIVMLGYQMTIEETTIPGPGHDVMRRVENCWVSTAQGSALSIAVGAPDKMRRVYDPREREWRERFVEACLATLRSEPYDGLFLDQCTIYNVTSADPAVRADMKQGIQDALTELRRQAPQALIVANSSFSFNAVNGELNETRPRDYAAELAPRSGHTLPRVELAHILIKSDADRRELKARMVAAREHGAYFGASRDYQHVEWYEEFDTRPIPRPPSKPSIENG